MSNKYAVTVPVTLKTWDNDSQTYRTRTVQCDLLVDGDAVARQLAPKAEKNKKQTSRLMHGAISLKVLG